MQLQIFNVQPELPQFGPTLISQLRALDSKIRRKGLEALDPSGNRLIAIGTEHDGKRVTKNGYGVLSLGWQARKNAAAWARQVNAEADEIRARIREAHGAPLQYLIWAGMGGSAEDKSAYLACGILGKGVRCYVLDSTDPAKLHNLLAEITRRSGLALKDALRRTLVVAMSMGMTSYEPVVNLETLAGIFEREDVAAKSNFLYMTIPGSALDQFGSTRGYRSVPVQLDGANTTAGRHSSPLTRGSLLPLALAGVDLEQWITGADLGDDDVEYALALASFLDSQGRYGRDKITLLPPKAWKGAGVWTKQDFEESLGKSEELGIKIVIGEPVMLRNYRPPKDPKQDRIFLCVRANGDSKEHAGKVQALRRAGYPVAVLTFPKTAILSTYMQFMHTVVFGMAWLRNMNFVTQPGVELYKAITANVHAKESGNLASPNSMRYGRNVTVDMRFTEGLAEEPDAPAALAAWVAGGFARGQAEYGELTFFGDMRYGAAGKQIRKILDRAASTLFRGLMKAPADVYEGPAVNHSYHEMIIGHGRCLSIVLIADKTAGYGEAGYHRSQFLATQMALAQRGRAVVSIVLKDLEPRSLADLEELFRETAPAIRNRLKHGSRR